jgi:membrane associated rhomboid family serine protease
MAKAHDWDEVRLAGALGILFGVAVCATLLFFRPEFDFVRSPTRGYAGLAVLFTLGMVFFTWRQERHRPARRTAHRDLL